MDLTVIVPSRGRPHNIAALADAWLETGATAELLVAVDHDDPRAGDYLALPGVRTVTGPRLRLGGTLNDLGPRLARTVDAVGFMGDDHRPRTSGWDGQVREALAGLGTGIAYGDDLIHGQALPTAVFMTADIVRALGWMVPPGLIHLFMDNAWLALGQALGRIAFLPDVVIEHMHPLVGKAPPDAGYREANAADVEQADRATFERWVSTSLTADVARIRAACGA